jgi:hypothetical protein
MVTLALYRKPLKKIEEALNLFYYYLGAPMVTLALYLKPLILTSRGTEHCLGLRFWV